MRAIGMLILGAGLIGVEAISANQRLVGQSPEARANQQQLLSFSIVGSSSCETTPCYSDVMKRIPVQALLLKLAGGRLAVREAETSPAGASILDLLSLRLIRREGPWYYLNFALFTAADVQRIREVSEHFSKSLAASLLAWRKEIDEVLREYDLPGVDPKAVAYFLLGCVSLDWDGLSITARKGFRKEAGERPDGNYAPAAQEITAATLERVYWGSHNAVYQGIHFTSFGDHHNLPRYMLPDLLWRAPAYPASYPTALTAVLDELIDKALERNGYQLGRIMLALRDGARTPDELARAAGESPADTKALLNLLTLLDYATDSGGRYQVQIPVFTRRDTALAARVRAIGAVVMDEWLSSNYPRIQAELSDLSFMRSGVPFAEGFTMVWHYLFGIANRRLVEAGLFADPYDPARRYRGAISVVYDIALP